MPTCAGWWRWLPPPLSRRPSCHRHEGPDRSAFHPSRFCGPRGPNLRVLDMTRLSVGRRQFLAGAASLSALALAGCATTTPQRVAVDTGPVRHPVPPDVQLMYGAVYDEPYFLRAADMSLVDPIYWRQTV